MNSLDILKGATGLAKAVLKPLVKPAAATLAVGALFIGDGHVNDQPTLCAQNAYILEGDPSAQIDKIRDHVRARSADFMDIHLKPRDSFSANESEAITFERQQLAGFKTALKGIILRAQSCDQDATGIEDDLNRFSKKADALEVDLDKLNRQLDTCDRQVDIEGPKIGKQKVPVYKFDLQPENKEDSRVPYVLCGTYLGDAQHNVELPMALALRGEKVYFFPYPERVNVQTPADWADRIKKDGTFGLHAEYVKEIIKALGLPKVNVVGFSMGASVALEMATDPDFGRINDLLVMEPIGFKNREYLDMGFGLFVKQGLWHTLLEPESVPKAVVWPWKDKNPVKDGVTVPIQDLFLKHQFDDAKMAKVNPQGRYQTWLASDSPVSSPELAEVTFKIAESKRGLRDQKSPVEIFHLEGGSHTTPIVRAFGVLEKSAQPAVRGDTYVNPGDLQNSAAMGLLEGLKK